LLASTGLVGFSRAIKVHDAIVLVLGGLVAGLALGTSAPGMDPQIVLFVFLPLIHAAVWFLDPEFTGSFMLARSGCWSWDRYRRAKKRPARIQKV
jgi:hypothetical protein